MNLNSRSHINTKLYINITTKTIRKTILILQENEVCNIAIITYKRNTLNCNNFNVVNSKLAIVTDKRSLTIKTNKIMKFIENNNVLIIVGTTRVVDYSLVKKEQQVNEQQYNLPKGAKITYSDGSMFIHCGNYAILRNWKYDGKTFDRVAIPWSMLYL